MGKMGPRQIVYAGSDELQLLQVYDAFSRLAPVHRRREQPLYNSNGIGGGRESQDQMRNGAIFGPSEVATILGY